jgi:hypothetical protein
MQVAVVLLAIAPRVVMEDLVAVVVLEQVLAVVPHLKDILLEVQALAVVVVVSSIPQYLMGVVQES